MAKAFATIVTPNYLSYALALRTSLSRTQNHEPLLVLIVADELPESLPVIQNTIYLSLSDISPSIPWLCKYYYMPFELCSALKPYILSHVLSSGYDSCIYLDSDIYVTHSFESIWPLCTQYPFSFTPHHLCPPPQLTYTSDILIAHFGVLNSGFYVCSASKECFEYLKWMQDQLVHAGFCNSVNGMFGDQKLIPQLFQYIPDSIQVLRNPALNISFWNAHERNVTLVHDTFNIDGVPALFFHLSGFDYRSPVRICSYLPFDVNLAIAKMAPWLSLVTHQYCDLIGSVQDYSSVYTCPYQSYNGIKLTRELRWLLYQKKHLARSDPDYLKLRLTASLKNIKKTIKLFKHH